MLISSTSKGDTDSPTERKEHGMDRMKAEHRGIWLAIIVLAGIVTAAITSTVLYLTGAPVAVVIGSAGAVFIAAVSLGIKIWGFIAD